MHAGRRVSGFQLPLCSINIIYTNIIANVLGSMFVGSLICVHFVMLYTSMQLLEQPGEPSVSREVG